MMNSIPGWDDTIIALATPPGIGAIGVIRLSGTIAFKIIASLFPSKNLLLQPSHTIHVGLLKNGEVIIDEVVVSLFKGPRSYTGEDVVEISCHGSPYIHQQVIEVCLGKGARVARAGEFTQRAFLYGKLDLTQAEAVADLISSNTNASHRAAVQNIRGGFSKVLKDLREQLIKFSALIELELDFSQEDVEFADRTLLYKLVNEASLTISQLLSSFKLGNVIKNGVQVAIVGKPNAGKSTLLNTLLNENRAIVSEIPGTTRDTIEETININGIIFRLVDTAGIREHTGDSIESMGIEKSLEKIEQSDIVLYLFDVSTMQASELYSIATKLKEDGRKFLLVANKSDLIADASTLASVFGDDNILPVSAKINQHIGILKDRLVDMVLQGQVQTEDIIITNARHYHALQEMSASLNEIVAALDNNIPSDLVALDIRRCLHFLGEITGEVTSEDKLDYIFSKFCIGK